MLFFFLPVNLSASKLTEVTEQLLTKKKQKYAYQLHQFQTNQCLTLTTLKVSSLQRKMTIANSSYCLLTQFCPGYEHNLLK